MNYAAIKKNDIANGPGVRVSLFVSGCRHHCKKCFNQEAWDFNYGKRFTGKELTEILSELHSDYVKGFSILGGEPFEPENQETLLHVVKSIKEAYPDKSIWCWTGYLMDVDLRQGGTKYTEYTDKLFQYIDVLVDGAFVDELKNIRLKFRGSSNQRIIDVKNSLTRKEIMLVGEYY